MEDETKLKWQSAGYEVIKRHQVVDRLDSNVAEVERFEQELKQLIPLPGSSNESPHLRKLRDILKKEGKGKAIDHEIHSGRSDRCRRHVTYGKSSEGSTIETELYWSGKRLIWSRGAVPIRSFSYEEDVRCACWAWMETESSDIFDPASHTSSQTASSSNTKDSFERRPPPRAKGTFRALCIFLSSCMVIYHPHTGQEYIKRLDLSVKSVHALDIGFLIQRETELEDRKKVGTLQSGNESADRPLPTLFYLRRPFDELKAVESVDQIRYDRNEKRDSRSGNAASLSNNVDQHIFDEVDESVIMVSATPPLLVSYSLQSQSLRTYTYAHGQVPFKRHEILPGDQKQAGHDVNTRDDEQSMRLSSSSTLMRRSTTDVPRPRPSTRQKLPPRKSARLESGSGRASIGGQRTSMASKRPRTTSNPGHVRRVSAGLTSIFGQSAFLHDEQEHGDTDEENIQDVMQLLDDFEEVQDDTSLLQNAPSGPPIAGSAAPSSSAAHRRRASRATLLPSAQQGIAPLTSGSARASMLQKARPIDGRRSSRPRMSMAPGISSEGNPISVAMELTQKDEASKMALTASTDKILSRGLSIEGGDAEHEMQTQSLSLFSSFSQGFAAVSLIEEIPLGKSIMDSNDIKAFVKASDEVILLYLVVPFPGSILTRQICQVPSKDTAQYTIRSQLPLRGIADSEVRCSNAFNVKSQIGRNVLIMQAEPGSSLHLVLGTPGPLAVSTDLNMGEKDLNQAEGMPLHLTTDNLSQLAIKLEPTCPLTSRVMSMCEGSLEPRLFREMHMAWIKSKAGREEHEWKIWSDILLYRFVRPAEADVNIRRRPKLDHLLDPSGKSISHRASIESQRSMWTMEIMADIIVILHWAAQESRADVCQRGRDLPRLGHIILTTAHHLGWKHWSDYWLRLLPSTQLVHLSSESLASVEEAPLVDLYDLMRDIKQGSRASIPQQFDKFLPRISTMIKVFSAGLESDTSDSPRSMSGMPISADLAACYQIVHSMLVNKMKLVELKTLPYSLSISMYEAIDCCRRDSPIGWPIEAYAFIGREDLVKQYASRMSQSENEDSHTSDPVPSSRLFTHDYRLREVGEMLQTNRPIAVRGPEVASVEDQELIAEKQRRVFVSASDRIKSLSVGRGMYSLSSLPFKSTEQWKILPISLRIKMLNNCIIQNRESDGESAEMEWPEFHNGIASALQLSIGSDDKVESTWLYSQLNKEFNSRHAGFILGIGLLGQLKNLGKIHAHHYLSHRHSPTTIGLLLGISLSFIKSCDPLAKALMSIHLLHTLPMHSRPLKTSMLEQSAALVGLGFVFLGSKDRWASRMAFRAIAADSVFTDDSQMLKRESFSLSAGISLGLTCLGGGRKHTSLAGEIEKEILPGLERLIKVFKTGNTSGRDDNQRKENIMDEKQYAAFQWAPDISLTTSPASIALALIYLKSNRKDKSEKMPLPENSDHLDSIRPDMLTIRALCRSLIEWDAIEASSQWLSQVSPDFLRFEDVKLVRKASENSQLAFWSLRLGSIFAIGLKYAGSSDASVRSCLLEQLHLYQSQVDQRPANYFEKIRQQLLQSSVDVILTALSMVMAGTGDVEILQHLRKALYRIDNLRYGNYMANSMAIGLLFLGAGKYTLSSSDIAIAALLISFYPRYPINAQDNRCHLQAYRHFWILAVEARLASVEDVDTGETTSMPIVLDKGDDAGTISLSTPCLLPQLDQIKSIKIASDRYFPSVLPLKGNDQFKGDLNAVRKLYIKKRAADLNYDEDRWGKGSVRAQRQGMSNCIQLPLQHSLEESSESSTLFQYQTREELKSLIGDNVHDQEVQTLLDVVLHCDSTSTQMNAEEDASELFILQSILDCLLEDKMDILPIMMGIYSTTQAFLTGIWSQNHLFQLQDLRFLLDSIKRSGRRDHSLLKESYLSFLWNLMQDKMITELTKEDDSALKQALVKYVSNLDNHSSSAWSEEVEERQQLAALLLVAEVPSLLILKEMKDLWNEQRQTRNMAFDIAHALMKSVLLEAGHNIRPEVLRIILQMW